MSGAFLSRKSCWAAWRWAGIVAGAVLVLASCGPRRQGAGAGLESPGRGPHEELGRRAERLWEARRQEDWAAVFQLQDPQEREGVGQADFVTWCEQKEPFRVHSFELGQMLVEGDLGWVEVHGSTSIRRFPDSPPRDTQQWEKWRRIEGDWYPVPRKELASYPASPALRDAAEEARLAERFAASWQARVAKDWSRLYAMTDPRDHGDVPQDRFAQELEKVEYISHEVQWVEVVGERGSVRVVYRHRLNDPSLTKLPPSAVSVVEPWIKCENEWYLDLKRP